MPEPSLTTRLFQFLRELGRNNNRHWFTQNKSRYERDVRDAAVQLVAELQKPPSKAALFFTINPLKNEALHPRIRLKICGIVPDWTAPVLDKYKLEAPAREGLAAKFTHGRFGLVYPANGIE